MIVRNLAPTEQSCYRQINRVRHSHYQSYNDGVHLMMVPLVEGLKLNEQVIMVNGRIELSEFLITARGVNIIAN